MPGSLCQHGDPPLPGAASIPAFCGTRWSRVGAVGREEGPCPVLGGAEPGVQAWAGCGPSPLVLLSGGGGVPWAPRCWGSQALGPS